MVGIWHCVESEEELKSMITLDANDNTKVNSFVNEKKKRHFLSTRLLCKELINCKTIRYNSDGKPYCDPVNQYLSVSHSHDYVAVIASSSPFIGIDIQREEEKILRIRDRFVNDTEREQIDFNNVSELTLIWCVKESIYKIHGDRNVFFKEHICIENLPKPGESRFDVRLDHHLYNSVHRMERQHIENYILVYTVFE